MLIDILEYVQHRIAPNEYCYNLYTKVLRIIYLDEISVKRTFLFTYTVNPFIEDYTAVQIHLLLIEYILFACSNSYTMHIGNSLVISNFNLKAC